MSVGIFQVLRATTEAVYGTYDVTNHGTAAEIYPRIEGANPFTPRYSPRMGRIVGADGLGRVVNIYQSKFDVQGIMKGTVYPTQALTLLGWPITLTSNDLSSFTVDYYDAVRSLSYLGMKAQTLKLDCSGLSEDTALKYEMNLIGSATAAPNANFSTTAVATNYPAEAPYTHEELSGGLTIGSSRSKFKSLSIEITNHFATAFDENRVLDTCAFGGRRIVINAVVQYLTTADRLAFETIPQVPVAMKAIWTKASPAHVLTLDFKSTAYVTAISDEIPLGDLTYQALRIEPIFDRTFGGDLALTAT